MPDLLYQAAIEYQKLKNTIYKIVLGRKQKSYILMLHFTEESFYHLAGLQHLTDLTFPSKNKERIYKEILRGKITNEMLKKSVFYDKWFIEERLTNLYRLKDMVETNSTTYLINQKLYSQYTKIKADYLCEQNFLNGIFYLFFIIEKNYPKFKNECKASSFFKKHNIDYTKGTSKTTILLIEKIVDGRTLKIYQNPSYKQK